jgi:hypothetical protein
MKILIMLLLSAAPVCAQWGRSENSSAAALSAARAEITVIGGAPLPDLLAARDGACQPLTIGGKNFLATAVFDDNWDRWFMLKPAAGGPGAGEWKETVLADGAVYNYDGLELRLKETAGVVAVETAGGEKVEIGLGALFDRLYRDSMKVVFGNAVTYAAFRNLAPLSGEEGTVMLRLGSDGRYYYSVTPDREIAAVPRWLLAINGVLYGLRTEAASLLFVSKPIEIIPMAFPSERARAR